MMRKCQAIDNTLGYHVPYRIHKDLKGNGSHNVTQTLIKASFAEPNVLKKRANDKTMTNTVIKMSVIGLSMGAGSKF